MLADLLLYSCLIRSLSEAASSVAASMIAAITIKPAENEPVQSLSQPIMLGPTKPPNTPTVLMKANPPAAPMPVKNRVGTFLCDDVNNGKPVICRFVWDARNPDAPTWEQALENILPALEGALKR